jgi:small subunit ribosomal protein S7
MARRRAAEKREILPDPKYGDEVISRFVNAMMLEGKKSIAESIFYGALDEVESKTKKNPLELFHEALDNVRPALEVKSRRIGGATYQIPGEVRPKRAQALAVRWLISAARKRSELTMKHRLAFEFMEAAQKRGSAVKKKDDTHRMADANRAFAHYKW